MPISRQAFVQGNREFEQATQRVLEFLRNDLTHAFTEAEIAAAVGLPDHPRTEANGKAASIGSSVLRALVLSGRIDARIVRGQIWFAHPDRASRAP